MQLVDFLFDTTTMNLNRTKLIKNEKLRRQRKKIQQKKSSQK